MNTFVPLPIVPYILIEGKSGVKYGFNIYNLMPTAPIESKELTNTNCVYILSRLEDNLDMEIVSMGKPILDLSRYRLIFIGESENMATEFKNHEKLDHINTLRPNFIFELPVNDKDKRLKIVQDVLEQYPFPNSL